MPDREKVITALAICTGKCKCFGCWYGQNNPDFRCQDRLKEDALALLKEQEPVELLDDGEDFVSIGDRMEITNRWKCGGCGHFVVYCETRPKIKFCHMCGREFKRG